MKRQLGSSTATHTAEASKASREIEHAAALTVNKSRNGQCTAATMGYADMQRAIGKFEAHLTSGGSGWKPMTAITDAAHEYNKFCVRESSSLNGRRSRRRKR